MSARKRRKFTKSPSKPIITSPSPEDNALSDLSPLTSTQAALSTPVQGSALLPVDILLLIVDAVGESDDPQSELCACALTCHSLRKRSQAHLFRSPTLSDAHDYTSFSRALDRSPELPRLVQSVRLYLNNIELDMPIPPHIIVQLTNLKSATFLGNATILGLPTPERAVSFVKLFGVLSATLARLELVLCKFVSFEELVRVVWSFPHVASLSLAACSWGNPLEQDGQVDCLPDADFYPRRAQGLTSLTLRLSSRLNLSLPAWGDGVRDLEIHGSNLADNFEGISAFRRLETLRLTLYGRDLSELVPALANVRSPAFRRLVVRHHTKWQKRKFALAQLKSLKLDDVLAPTEFPHLEAAEWTICCREPLDEEDGLRWVRDIGERMAGVRDRGLLTCTIVRENIYAA